MPIKSIRRDTTVIIKTFLVLPANLYPPYTPESDQVASLKFYFTISLASFMRFIALPAMRRPLLSILLLVRGAGIGIIIDIAAPIMPPINSPRMNLLSI
jgi:hypothetical protein